MANPPIDSSFSSLFKKFRLRSQIETLARFGDLLAEEGLVYENSLYSRWQIGERIPKDRKVLLSIIYLFLKQGGMRSYQEANALLASVGQRDLTEEEKVKVDQLITRGGVSANELVEYHSIEEYSEREVKSVTKFGGFLHLFSTLFDILLIGRIISIFRIGPIKLKMSGAGGLVTGYSCGIFIWWIFLTLSQEKNSFFNYAYAFAYGIIPLLGGLSGIIASQKWTPEKSSMGKALLCFSLGLITWGVGEMIWTYYVFILKIIVPYPSLADVSFIISWPLWSIALHYLALATGIKYGIRTSAGKSMLFIIPLTVIIISYYLLIVVARNGQFTTSVDWLKIFFDLAYPFFDVIIITQAFLILGLSSGHTQNRYRWPLFIILGGFIVNYLADFGFSYTTTNGSFYNGSFVDLFFTIALYIISIGVNSFEAS